jgi:3-oxoacyl-[acyl-carrier protein] reductase
MHTEPTAPPPLPATVIVTGAGRGIGRAVALDLAETTQAALVLVSRTVSCVAAATACNAHRPGCARAMRWDLADWRAGAAPFARIVQEAAGPVALVHAAGVLGPTGPFADNDPTEWWRAVDLNLGAAVRVVHAVLRRMRVDGAGRIVLFAGGGAAHAYPLFSSYGTAKAALVRFTETVAMELGDNGPVITIMAPGTNDTDLLAEVRRTGGMASTTVSIDEPCRLVRRLLSEDTRGLHGRFVHVRDTWTPGAAAGLADDVWRLRRVE